MGGGGGLVPPRERPGGVGGEVPGEDKVSGQAKLFTDPQGQAPAPPTVPGLAQAAAHPRAGLAVHWH